MEKIIGISRVLNSVRPLRVYSRPEWNARPKKELYVFFPTHVGPRNLDNNILATQHSPHGVATPALYIS